jgi:hypothetical protein
VQRAVGGPYQMRCPGSNGLQYADLAGSCPQRVLLDVGSGPIATVMPAVVGGNNARATTGPDGRVWVVDKQEIRVSADAGATWQAVPPAPALDGEEWSPKFSPDGTEVWLRRAGRLYLLAGNAWREQPGYLTGLTNPIASESGWAPLWGGMLALIDEGRLVFSSKDGPVSAFTGVRAQWMKVLPDGSILTGDAQGNCALGVGTGADREWTVFQF